MVTQCVYNTTGRSKVTRMGEATDDEMCISFFMYYPGTAMYACEEYSTWSYKGFLVTPGGSSDDIFIDASTAQVPQVSPRESVRSRSAAACPAGCSPRCAARGRPSPWAWGCVS